jgi:Rieske Fe-S protein
MELTSGTPATTTRRTVVAMAGTTGLAAALAACGSSGSGSASGSGDSGSSSSAGGAQSGGQSAPAGGGKTPLAKTSQIPEGGGMVFADQKVVVTQPTAGEFKAFSAICTHMGCTVSQVKDGTIDCPCHGSKYHITDGSVAGGPAPKPLPPAKITVAGGEVTLD